MAIVDLKLFELMAAKRTKNRIRYLQRVAGRPFWSWTCASAFSSAQVCSDMSRTGEGVLAEGTLVRNDSLISQIMCNVVREEEVGVEVAAGESSAQVHEGVDVGRLVQYRCACI
eukprot:8797806-Heterocapsa_arctica.AAC.1